MNFEKNIKIVILVGLVILLIYLVNVNKDNSNMITAEATSTSETPATTGTTGIPVEPETPVKKTNFSNNKKVVNNKQHFEQPQNETMFNKQMKKYNQQKNEKMHKFSSDNLKPKSKEDWFQVFDQNQVSQGIDDNLIMTDKYVIGVNTVGQSLKNASYDIRAAPAVPKFIVSPWMNSTIEPDYNIRPFEDANCPSN
tara:strand:+ start:259 stop:846 length:588 start_codon:yes stop_codon:yes gene_type:complete